MESRIKDIDISPEAIKAYLIPFASLFIRYIQIRADEKGGLDKLFDGSGARLVLATKNKDAKEQDNDDTKKLIDEIKAVLTKDILQLSLKDKIARWEPELTTTSVNAVYVDIQRRYFGPVSESTAWKDFVKTHSSSLSKQIEEQIKAAFCLWIVFSFLDKLDETEENLLLKEKAHLLVKIINGVDDFPALVEVQKNSLRSRLNKEFDRIQLEFGEKKHDKKEILKILRDLLKQNFDKVLLENWLPKEEKEKIAVETMDTFKQNLHQDKKLEKHKKEIYAELFEHLKSFLQNTKSHRSKSNPFTASQDGFYGATAIAQRTGRSKSIPDQVSAAVMAELTQKLGMK